MLNRALMVELLPHPVAPVIRMFIFWFLSSFHLFRNELRMLSVIVALAIRFSTLESSFAAVVLIIVLLLLLIVVEEAAAAFCCAFCTFQSARHYVA